MIHKFTKEDLEVLNPMRIFFEDECPRIGSGWRTVDIKIGRKWITFQSTSSGVRAKLPIKDGFPIIMESIRRSKK